MDVQYEYYALRYLLQWEHKERALHKRMAASPSGDDVRESLAYFQVARSFKDLKKRSHEVLKLLLSMDSYDNLSFYAKADQLARCFESDFQRFNISAASKLLWLRHREPYVLYDSRAVKALRDKGCSFEFGDYKQYCKEWRRQYELHAAGIQQASSRLVTIHPSFLPGQHDKASLSILVKQQWFLERVFDNYLWELGGGDIATG